MNSPVPQTRPAQTRWILIAAAVIAAAASAAYSDSFAGPFLYDDLGSIPQNPTLQHLLTALSPPPGGMPVSGRPLVNFSFAVNYAISGTAVWSYHALNLLIHILASLTLFGIVRRTLALPGWRPPDSDRLGPALAVSLLWALHPVQTEAVTYMAQRAESLMALFYLASLYCFIRSATDGVESASGAGAGTPAQFAPRRGWAAASCTACVLGMTAKEVMVTAPVAILLYDRCFIAGSFREAWARRRAYYAALALSWAPLACLVAATGNRGGTAGFGTGVAPWAYALTQFRAVATYLRLSVWPHPLIADYGRILGGPPVELALQALLVSGLAVVSAALLGRRNPFGFLGAWFFLILAPSSSVVPVATELVAEHRMYLPLAAVISGVVLGGWAVLRRAGPALGLNRRVLAAGGIAACAGVCVAFGAATYRRNTIYQGNLVFWGDAAVKVPENAGARCNYGNALAEAGNTDDAIAQYRAALRLAPDYADAHFNLGNALKAEGHLDAAIENYRAALRFRPADPMMHHGLGLALLKSGREADAQREFEQAVRLYQGVVRQTPDLISAHYDLANVLSWEGNRDGAVSQYRAALALRPDYAEAWYNLANVLADAGRLGEAAACYEATLRLQPANVDAHVNYGNILAQMNRPDEAVAQFRDALLHEPGAADIHNNLGSLLAQTGRLGLARVEFEEALRLKPDYREARDNLRRLDVLEKRMGGP